jgi:hypothetical protein
VHPIKEMRYRNYIIFTGSFEINKPKRFFEYFMSVETFWLVTEHSQSSTSKAENKTTDNQFVYWETWDFMASSLLQNIKTGSGAHPVSSSSCSWRVKRVSCSLILKMKLVPPSLPRSSLCSSVLLVYIVVLVLVVCLYPSSVHVVASCVSYSVDIGGSIFGNRATELRSQPFTSM